MWFSYSGRFPITSISVVIQETKWNLTDEKSDEFEFNFDRNYLMKDFLMGELLANLFSLFLCTFCLEIGRIECLNERKENFIVRLMANIKKLGEGRGHNEIRDCEHINACKLAIQIFMAYYCYSFDRYRFSGILLWLISSIVVSIRMRERDKKRMPWIHVFFSPSRSLVNLSRHNFSGVKSNQKWWALLEQDEFLTHCSILMQIQSVLPDFFSFPILLI